MRLEVDTGRQVVDLVGDDGGGLAVLPLDSLIVEGGRVMVMVEDAAVAARFDAADLTVVHAHPEPTRAQMVEAVHRLPAQLVEQAMLTLGEHHGMDASPGVIARAAIAYLLGEAPTLEEDPGGAQAEPR